MYIYFLITLSVKLLKMAYSLASWSKQCQKFLAQIPWSERYNYDTVGVPIAI